MPTHRRHRNRMSCRIRSRQYRSSVLGPVHRVRPREPVQGPRRQPVWQEISRTLRHPSGSRLAATMARRTTPPPRRGRRPRPHRERPPASGSCQVVTTGTVELGFTSATRRSSNTLTQLVGPHAVPTPIDRLPPPVRNRLLEQHYGRPIETRFMQGNICRTCQIEVTPMCIYSSHCLRQRKSVSSSQFVQNFDNRLCDLTRHREREPLRSKLPHISPPFNSSSALGTAHGSPGRTS
ncbi:hypothetical protein J2S48_000346 [Promicromonospora iranensis]|uniref:Uncharacterized protein n=1 Tax=Promicromonospora iranensis TaxID=1105144 RepID=A0ABU2CHL3_9MICO|nr:hypothetical protein [Promicromonospora iranensis]